MNDKRLCFVHLRWQFMFAVMPASTMVSDFVGEVSSNMDDSGNRFHKRVPLKMTGERCCCRLQDHTCGVCSVCVISGFNKCELLIRTDLYCVRFCEDFQSCKPECVDRLICGNWSWATICRVMLCENKFPLVWSGNLSVVLDSVTDRHIKPYFLIVNVAKDHLAISELCHCIQLQIDFMHDGFSSFHCQNRCTEL